MKTYVLDENRNAVPCDDVLAWAQFFEDAGKRRVAHDELPGAEVSTVFLGLDHSFGGSVPMLFETMVFGGPLDQQMERYALWDEAIAGHAAMVAKVRAAQ